MSNTSALTLSDAARALIKADVAAFKRDGKRYADYVAEMSVTADTVAEHVAEFRSAFKASNPKADGAAVKAYATKVRNGLNYHVKGESTRGQSDKFVTALGLKADDREAFLIKCAAEWDAANAPA